MILLIDNYDSFTYNLTDYFAQLGEDILLFKNDEINAADLSKLNFDKIVISPGPNRPKDSGNLMSIIEETYDKYPILGICLGHQALGEFFGAELTHAAEPMHGKVSRIQHTGDGLYKNLPNEFNVCRYHSLILKNFENTELKQNAWTLNHECMGIEHTQLPIVGVQFHPEAILSEYGLDLLKNWLDGLKIS
jgi:anthranilate synthase/aminodeoxychorismate synthase-like glutamine amidotransferase